MIAPWSVITAVCCSEAVNISSDQLLLLWENLCVFLFLNTAVWSNRERSGENIIETFFLLLNADMPGSEIPLNFNSFYFSFEVVFVLECVTSCCPW